jgi:PEP-CTERM motif
VNRNVVYGMVAIAPLLVAGVKPASAGLWAASGTGSDGALDAEANFTVSAGQIQVTITNLLNPATIISIGQSVSDLSFTLSNTPGADTGNTAVGQLVNVASGGGVTDTSGGPTRWINSSIGGGVTISSDTVTLEAIGHGSPTELILPSDDGGGYPDAVASIVGHSPNVDGSATFTLDFAGVTSATTVSNVKFSFGTGPDTFLGGSPSGVTTTGRAGGTPVPEPASFALLGSGLLGLGYFRRRRT